jgi:hypothetical protein
MALSGVAAMTPAISPRLFSRQLQRMLIKSYWDRGIRPAARQYRAELPAILTAFAAMRVTDDYLHASRARP